MRNYDDISSEEEDSDMLGDSEHAETDDAEDDYDEDQDRLQVLPADKRTFCELQSNNLLASNASSNDLPSLKQINRQVKTTTKPPERDRRYNRRTAGLLYPIEEATWEPYSEFKGNNKFYDFCKANNHMDLIDQRLFSDD